MEPAFAEAVDQAFVAALELLERITLQEAKDPATERSQMKGWIERAEAQVVDNEEWELAKYALVGWLDAEMIAAPWEGATFWEENPLEREYYYERKAFTNFFVNARQAAQMPRKNALEVYYLCVVFGFRGLYGPPPEARADGERPEDFDLPKDIQTWASQINAQLRVGAARAPLNEEPQPIAYAPAMEGTRTLIVSIAVSAMMAAWPLGMLLWTFIDQGR